jgi:hypothetical protein
MKAHILTFITLAFLITPSFGQDTIIKKGKFIPFLGFSTHAYYNGTSDNPGSHSSLNGALSPGFELGISYEHILVKRLYGCIGLGLDFGFIRNKFEYFEQPFYSSMSFVSGYQFIGFQELSLRYRLNLFKGSMYLRGGYRLNYALNTISGYGESNHDASRQFDSEVYINPNSRFAHGMLLGLEYLFSANNPEARKFSVAIQGVGIFLPDDYIRGTYTYVEPNTYISGTYSGNMAHASLILNYYL